MTERAPIPKKLRFEVFKRDSFTCQYCGRKSPEFVLHCDHIKPVAEGGATEMLNLVTACNACNLGKGAILLDDASAVERQRRQIEELNERRQQIEMMLEWRDELAKHQVDEVQVVADAMSARSKFEPNDNGKAKIRRWIKKHGLSEVLASMDEAFDRHLTNDSQATWEFAFNKIPSVASLRAQERVDPHIRKLLYIQAILRNRWDIENLDCVAPLRKRLDAGLSIEALELAAKSVRFEDAWKDLDEAAASIMKRASAAAPPEPKASPQPARRYDIMTKEEEAEAADKADFFRSIWASALRETDCENVLICLSSAANRHGYVWADLDEGDLSLYRGMQAVGLLAPATDLEVDDLYYQASDGRWRASFALLDITPETLAQSFNRFGGLALSAHRHPLRFSPVDRVH